MKGSLTNIIRALFPVLTSFSCGLLASGVTEMIFPAAFPRQTIGTVMGAVLSLPVAVWLWKGDRRCRPASVAARPAATWLLAAAFVMGAVCSLLSSELMEAFGVYEHFSNAVQEQFYRSPVWFQAAGLGVIVPISEELTYRGVFYERLREFAPRNAALILTALVFALGHGNWIQAMYAFPMSLLLGMCYERSGSLAVPVAIHMGANLISVAVSCLG